MRRKGVRGAIAAVVTAGALYVFLTLTLHSNELLTLAGSTVLGVCILAVVATQGDESQLAADEAWREAAPDLPPVSDRLALEKTGARSHAMKARVATGPDPSRFPAARRRPPAP